MEGRRTTSIILTTLLFTSGAVHAGNAGGLHEGLEVQPSQSLLLAQVTKAKDGSHSEHQLLEGNRPVFGKVEAVTSDQIKVDIGEIQPGFLPLKQAKEKHFPAFRPDDDLVLVLNEQNLIVDYHPREFPSSHKIVTGAIADTMPVGHGLVVIKGTEGKEQSFTVRSQARSKLAAIPVGTPAVFLLDETNQGADATFAGLSAAKDAHKNFEGKSSITGANRQIEGTVVQPLRADRITLKTEDHERSFEVHGVMHERISRLPKGESVILIVDNDNKVLDVAVPPQ